MPVKIEMKYDAEPAAKRGGQHSRTRSSSDQRKFREFQFDRPGGRALAYHNVEAVILHCGIQYLLDRRIEAMNLVNKEHIAFVKIGQYSSEIARFFDDRAGGRLERRTHFVGDDVGERCFAQSGRPRQQYVVECLATLESGLHKDAQILLDLFLPDVIGQLGRTQ